LDNSYKIKNWNVSSAFQSDKWLAWQDRLCHEIKNLKSLDEKNINKIVKREFPRARVDLVVGMKRSGNHAIINWFVQNCFESLVYANNVTGEIPDSWSIYSAEYITPRMIDRVVLSVEHKSICEYQSLNPILIARDPYNWLASWISHTHFIPENLEKDIDIYLYNLSNHTSIISFNQWFSSREYRDSIANKLGVINSDISINGVTSFGKGSSFDKKSFDGKAQKMKVLRRWEKMKSNNLYVHTIQKYEKCFRDISVEHFPDIDADQIHRFLDR